MTQQGPTSEKSIAEHEGFEGVVPIPCLGLVPLKGKYQQKQAPTGNTASLAHFHLLSWFHGSEFCLAIPHDCKSTTDASARQA